MFQFFGSRAFDVGSERTNTVTELMCKTGCTKSGKPEEYVINYSDEKDKKNKFPEPL